MADDVMRTVVLLINTFELGGAEGIYIQLANGLLQRGHRVIAACLQRRSGRVEDAFDDPRIEILDLNVRSKFDVRAFWRLVHFLKTNQVDVVYTFLIHSHLVGRLAARLSDVPVVISSQQTMQFESRLMRWANRATAGCCSAVIAVSRNVEDYLIKDVGVPRSKVTTIYNAIDVDRFAGIVPRARTDDQTVNLGYCARLRPEKGHEALLRALQLARQTVPNVRLLLAGDGPERQRLERFVASEGLEGHVEFLGHVEDVASFYARLDVYVQASYIEGLPLAVLEALACSIPVVASRVGGNEEIVGQEAGLLVPPRNPAALAEAITWMAAHRTEARQMGINGCRVVKERFSAPTMITATEQLMRRLWNEA